LDRGRHGHVEAGQALLIHGADSSRVTPRTRQREARAFTIHNSLSKNAQRDGGPTISSLLPTRAAPSNWTRTKLGHQGPRKWYSFERHVTRHRSNSCLRSESPAKPAQHAMRAPVRVAVVRFMRRMPVSAGLGRGNGCRAVGSRESAAAPSSAMGLEGIFPGRVGGTPNLATGHRGAFGRSARNIGCNLRWGNWALFSQLRERRGTQDSSKQCPTPTIPMNLHATYCGSLRADIPLGWPSDAQP
jgi:hypothetical protein